MIDVAQPILVLLAIVVLMIASVILRAVLQLELRESNPYRTRRGR